jgi:hypothetical protein
VTRCLYHAVEGEVLEHNDPSHRIPLRSRMVEGK